MTTTTTARARLTLLIMLSCVVASCSSSASKSSTTSTVLVTAASFTTVVPTTTTAPPASSTTAPTTTNPATLSVEDSHKVDDCVRFIPIGAITSDAEATDLWALVAQDATKLPALCTGLLQTSPATLDSLSLKLTAFEIGQETDLTPTSAAESTTTTLLG